MARYFHGVISLLLVIAALIIGAVGVFKGSLVAGIIYLLIVLLSFPAIIYSFCSKCPCRFDSCGHVIPGRLTRLFPSRDQGEYTKIDIMGTAIPFVLCVIIPQWWLITENLKLLAAFWILFIIGIIQIISCVCPECENRNCPMNQG